MVAVLSDVPNASPWSETPGNVVLLSRRNIVFVFRLVYKIRIGERLRTMEFCQWCRTVRSSYRAAGEISTTDDTEEPTVEPGDHVGENTVNTTDTISFTKIGNVIGRRKVEGGEVSDQTTETVVVAETGQESEEKELRSVPVSDTCHLKRRGDSLKDEHSPKHFFATSMSGQSPFDVPITDSSTPELPSFDVCGHNEHCKEAREGKTQNQREDEQEQHQGKSEQVLKRPSYFKSNTFPTSRLEKAQIGKQIGDTICVASSQGNHVDGLNGCPPHGAKSVMGRRAKMEDTFVAMPNLLEIAFADSMNEIIPPRIADQIQQTVNQSGDEKLDTARSSLAIGLNTSSEGTKEEFFGSEKKNLCKGKWMKEHIHFFGVFDGHGGADAAHHCQDTMHERLKDAILASKFARDHKRHHTNEHNESNDGVEVLDLEVKLTTTGSMDHVAVQDVESVECSSEVFSQALAEAFRSTDEEFAKLSGDEDQLALVGTTAVVALLSSKSMFVANCGDSRAVLCRNGNAFALTDDHKAAREDETARVEAAGGQILFWNGVRVMGLLAVSRAIGDHSLRPYVIADPEVTVVNRHPGDELLVMASDGLWDVISNQEACALAKKCLLRARQKGSTRENAARVAATVLTRAAVDRGSRDNITVLVIDLMQDPDELLEADAMKMRMSEEIVMAEGSTCNNDTPSVAQEEGAQTDKEPVHTEEESNTDAPNNIVEEKDDEEEPVQMSTLKSFKSPFELMDAPTD